MRVHSWRQVFLIIFLVAVNTVALIQLAATTYSAGEWLWRQQVITLSDMADLIMYAFFLALAGRWLADALRGGQGNG